MATPKSIPRRPLGKTGVTVSAMGLGGAHLAEAPSEKEAMRIVAEAIDAGIDFMDNAWEYSEGKAEPLMGKALAGRRDQVFLMTKVCTHGRDGKVAMKQLEQSLRRLRTDHLDLWQVHECIYDNDPERHFAARGVVEAMDRAKRQGKVRFVGFTGHKDPSIHLAMLAKGYPFDTCQLPLNCFDGAFRSFEQRVLPMLVKRGIAPLAMKTLGGEGDAVRKKVVSVEEALRYVLSLPVATIISGIDSLKVLRQNLKIVRAFEPMTLAQRERLRRRIAQPAADGRYELYKTSKKFDGQPGRKEHGFPSDEELAG